MMFAGAMALALCLDALLGWPDGLYRRIGHPVTWIGRVITWSEHRLNTSDASDQQRLWRGGGVVAGVLALVVMASVAILAWVPDGAPGIIVTGVLAWPWIAARSLYTHVAAVAHPLEAGDLDAARTAVSHVVGRDPRVLDAEGVSRAAIETLAENASDGVVAPVFWGVLLGLPGIAAYKAINTLDSMIGHRNARYEHFGKVAARLDDLVNLIPARLTAVMFACVSPRIAAALKTVRQDARHHRSPNAGWPEAAMAGALSIRLSGPRIYDAGRSDEPWVNAGAPDPTAQDIRRGLALYRRAMGLGLLMLLVLALLG